MNEERIQRKTRKSPYNRVCEMSVSRFIHIKSFLFISYSALVSHSFEHGLQVLSTFCLYIQKCSFSFLNNFHICKTIFMSYFMLIWSSVWLCNKMMSFVLRRSDMATIDILRKQQNNFQNFYLVKELRENLF